MVTQVQARPMESKELSRAPASTAVGMHESTWRTQLDLVKSTCAPGTTDDEFKLFIYYCESNEFDPLNKDAWCQIRRSQVYNPETGQKEWQRRLVMGAGIGGVRKRLEGQPDFAGIESAAICEKDVFEMDASTGEVKHKIIGVTIQQRGRPVGAWCRIKRKDKAPLLRVVSFAERVVDGNPCWDRMPMTMIEKCASMDAIRAAYPSKFAGVYTDEELAADPTDVPPVAAGQPALPAPVAVATPETVVAESPKPEEADSAVGAFVTPDQFNAMKLWMQEFKLSGDELGQLIGAEAGPKPPALSKLTKPQFLKLGKVFAEIRTGAVTLDRSTMKISRPPSP